MSCGLRSGVAEVARVPKRLRNSGDFRYTNCQACSLRLHQGKAEAMAWVASSISVWASACVSRRALTRALTLLINARSWLVPALTLPAVRLADAALSVSVRPPTSLLLSAPLAVRELT